MYDGGDYELVWPRHLFVHEASNLLNHRRIHRDWDDRCLLLLDHAFAGPTPQDDFRQAAAQSPPPRGLSNGQAFLRDLMSSSEQLRETTTPQYRPYWSERRAGTSPDRAGLRATARQFIDIVSHLNNHGYFEQAFGKDCVDDPSEIDPSAVIERAIGAADLWPLTPDRLAQNIDVFCDVVEVLHDLVARPRSRGLHDYDGCGWHYRDFSPATGRVVYRWRVNGLLERSDLGLHLADEGEDVGRLVTSTDPARSDLLSRMAQRESPAADRLRHAISLYRARHADEHTKRSAVVVLSGVLEERRQLIKDELLSKDEGDLFTIANKFAIRHQNEQQKTDYSAEFLDWIFWWYLATIELTDHLLAR
ncbi:hypothetical protein Franean1_2792 [Parafrankia sp. EAN1pec]|uniref:hypothetical protein n=1 Tax=Parafrankia sp. (strain EAN1pec) TaxID=298653 RepID=UPI00005436D4|nr:hypothetical protein Franean1_2792 [Frankia sp. EAN1pec]